MSTIPLTALDQHDLTRAMQMENEGFHEAARWLRSQIPVLKGVPWDSEPEEDERHDDVARAWETLFRVHRGSLPPVPQPMSHTPAPRPDQILS